MKNKLIGISGRIGSGKDTLGTIFQYLEYRKTFKVTIPISEKNFNIFVNSLAHVDQIWKIKKFADKLKEMVCLLIGCTREQLEDRDFKEKELGEEWSRTVWHIQSNHNRLDTYNSKEEAESDLSHYDENYNQEVYIASEEIVMTPRLMLQLLGTECGRDIIHPNIWVNALFANHDKYLEFCMQNELSKLKDKSMMGGFSPNRSSFELPNWIITDVRFPNEAQAIKDRGGILIRINRPQLIERDFEHLSETALDDYDGFDYVINNDTNSVRDLVDKVKELKIV